MSDPTMLNQALGQLSGVLRPVAETGCKLIEALLGEPIAVAGGMVADQVYMWRWKNRLRIADRASKIMKERHIAAKVLPPDFLLPLLEAAGDVEHPELQEMWANLLAAGVDDEVARHPTFMRTLQQLSTADVLVLTEYAKERAGYFDEPFGRGELAKRTGLSSDLVRLARSNLYRLGLLMDSFAHLSRFGAELFHLCTGKQPQEWVEDQAGGYMLNQAKEELERVAHAAERQIEKRLRFQ